jgi:hypothetical protein
VYQSGCQAWTEKDEKKDPILANEFIQEIERALLELIKAGLRGAVPHAEPHAATGRAGANPDKAAGEWLRHHEMKFEWDEPHQLGLSVAKLDRPFRIE